MNVASTLSWILGVINLLGGIFLGIPAIATGKPVFFPLAIFGIGIGLCFSGYGLRKKRSYAGFLAIIFSVLSFISPPVIGIIMGIAIIIITAINWKQLT